MEASPPVELKQAVLQDKKEENQTAQAKKKVTPRNGDSAPSRNECIIDWIVDHSKKNGGWKLKVRWYEDFSMDNI